MERGVQPVEASAFNVIAIEKTTPPDGAATGVWYRYVLENGKSTITGYRQGSKDQVAKYARDFAADVNARASRGYNAWQRGAAKK
jgi:hypothetical protein